MQDSKGGVQREEKVFMGVGGVTLPGVEIISQADPSIKDLCLVLGHGLGAKNPKLKDHTSDHWLPIVADTAVASGVQSVAMYSSRGHRGTDGWQASAVTDPEQFSWARLAQDMMSVSRQICATKAAARVVVGGSSMGSAAAFFAALQYPDEVAAVIMIRPPTGWSERLARKDVLLSSAKKCAKDNLPEERYHCVLEGTALSDFPALDDRETYSAITCPVLILAMEGDETHPLATAFALAERLPRAELVVSKTMDEAKASWPPVVAKFLQRLSSGDASSSL